MLQEYPLPKVGQGFVVIPLAGKQKLVCGRLCAAADQFVNEILPSKI